MTFSDAIKNSVLGAFKATNLTTSNILLTLLIASVLGIYIYVIYRVNTKSSFYSRTFNKTLGMLPVITAGILLAMQSNLVISLGMVGALSIVRFRNAVKDPMDLTFLFWSISVGIVAGAGLFELAGIISVVLTILTFGFDLLPAFRAPYLLVIAAESADMEQDIWNEIRVVSKGAKLRSRNVTKHSAELVVEIKLGKDYSVVDRISAIDGVYGVNLLSHDGEVRF